MRRAAKVGLFAMGAIILWVGISIGRLAWQARRPADMPSGSIWIDAPPAPFGFYRGWWLGCWIDSDRVSNRCRLWGSGGLGIVYEGTYISCDQRLPVTADQLQLSPEAEVHWLPGGIPGAFVDLTNGKILVPSTAPTACQSIEDQKSRDHLRMLNPPSAP